MVHEFKSQFPDSLSTIFISNKETCDINRFVKQYVESRHLHFRSQAESEVFTALRAYPGMAPVRFYELNAWLDRHFRAKVFLRPAARLLKLMVNKNYMLRPQIRLSKN